MPLQHLLDALGEEIEDSEEEAFLLFSQSVPSQNLGFVDPKATVLELAIGDRDLTIHQSPTILSSSRGRGTTGAVVWKITPLFAAWISSPSNLFHKHGIISPTMPILELGCGISGIIALALAPHVKSYTLTDQEYVMKLLHQNILENSPNDHSSISKGRKSAQKPKRGSAAENSSKDISNIISMPLDWETDQVTTSLTGSDSLGSFSAVIACDCIYNDALIEPLVQTCADACRLRSSVAESNSEPTICIIAQQLRSSEVFEGWLRQFLKYFRAWRVPDTELIEGLQSDSGFVVHAGILRSNA